MSSFGIALPNFLRHRPVDDSAALERTVEGYVVGLRGGDLVAENAQGAVAAFVALARLAQHGFPEADNRYDELLKAVPADFLKQAVIQRKSGRALSELKARAGRGSEDAELKLFDLVFDVRRGGLDLGVRLRGKLLTSRRVKHAYKKTRMMMARRVRQVEERDGVPARNLDGYESSDSDVSLGTSTFGSSSSIDGLSEPVRLRHAMQLSERRYLHYLAKANRADARALNRLGDSAPDLSTNEWYELAELFIRTADDQVRAGAGALLVGTTDGVLAREIQAYDSLSAPSLEDLDRRRVLQERLDYLAVNRPQSGEDCVGVVPRGVDLPLGTERTRVNRAGAIPQMRRLGTALDPLHAEAPPRFPDAIPLPPSSDSE